MLVHCGVCLFPGLMEHFVGSPLHLSVEDSIDYDLSFSEREALLAGNVLFRNWAFNWTCELFELDEGGDLSMEGLASLQIPGALVVTVRNYLHLGGHFF